MAMGDAQYKLWLETKLGKAVKGHIDGGFKVFPVHGVLEPDENELVCTCGYKDCGKLIGKHPFCKNGFKDATDNIELAAELFNFREDLNIGVATGEVSGIVVIDIDSNKGGDESLLKIQQTMGYLPPTMKFLTGNGYHLVFNYPNIPIKSRTNIFGKDSYPGIDVRGDGGYIIVFPSRHNSGRYYEYDKTGPQESCDLPKNYIDFLSSDREKKYEKVDPNQRSGNKSEWDQEEIRRMLDFIGPDDGSYDDWIAVGMALHKEGCPLSMWDQWSQSGPKYPRDGIALLNQKWRGFKSSGTRTIGTVVERAMQRGWKPQGVENQRLPSAIAEAVVGNLVIKANVKRKEIIKNSQEEKPKLPFNPLEIPGHIGDTIRWIVKHSIYEQPELAMINLLAFGGAVFGRRYASPIDTRTNLYTVGISRTASGKEFSVQMIEKLALECGLVNYIGANGIRSDIGILKGLMRHSSQILAIDEFGMVMQNISGVKAASYQKAIGIVITKIYSKSGSLYKHGDISDERAKLLIIASPNLCIYGTTTEESYIKSLTRESIKTGELNRFIAIPSSQKPRPKRNIERRKMDSTLMDWWSQFAPEKGKSLGEIINNATIAPIPKTVEWGECEELVYEMMDGQSEICNSSATNKDLWGRYSENVIKLAMVLAIARNPAEPVFEKDDFYYGQEIVKLSIRYMGMLADSNMADTIQEANYLEALNFIKENGTVSRQELLRKFRKIKMRDTDDIMGTMVQEGVIDIERIPGTHGGQARIMYNYIGEKYKAA